MDGMNNENGLTVVELVIALSIFALLLAPIFGLLHSAINSYLLAEAGVNQQQNLRIAMEAITKDLRQSTGLIDRAHKEKLDERNLLLVMSGDQVIWYYRKDKSLYWAQKKKGELSFYGFNPVADGITKLEFDYNKIPFANSDYISISIAGEDDLGNTYELNSTVYLRSD